MALGTVFGCDAADIEKLKDAKLRFPRQTFRSPDVPALLASLPLRAADVSERSTMGAR